MECRLLVSSWLLSLISVVTGRVAVDQLYAPVNLRLVDYTDQGARLTWDYPVISTADQPVPEEVPFIVKYRAQNGGREPWKLLKTSSKEAFLPLRADSLYEVRVSALPTVIASASTSEKLFQKVAPTSERLSVETPSSVPYALPEQTSILLKPPSDLRTSVLSTTEIQLDWSPPQLQVSPADLFYEVLVQKYERSLDQFGSVQVVRVSGTTVRLNDLRPGASYKFRVVAKTAEFESEPSVFTIQQTPLDREGIDISRPTISPDRNSDEFLLTWEAEPAEMVERVKEFIVHYAESMDAADDEWHTSKSNGNELSARLSNMKPGTAYFLTIETIFLNGAKSLSSIFKFRAPQVSAVQDIKIDYGSDARVKVQWTLHGSIDKMNIVGYRLIYTNDSEKPETDWQSISVNGREAEAFLDGVKVNQRYLIRIIPKTTSGTELSSHNIFSFRTYETQYTYAPPPISLSYGLVSPRQVRLRWRTPTANAEKIIGYTVMYSPVETLPDEQWMKVLVTDPATTELDITVEPNRPYYVKIVPKTSDGYSHAVSVHRILSDAQQQQQQRKPEDGTAVSSRVVFSRNRRSGQRVTLRLCRTTEHTAVGCESGELCLADPSCFGNAINVCAPSGICIPPGLENGLRQHFSSPQN